MNLLFLIAFIYFFFTLFFLLCYYCYMYGVFALFQINMIQLRWRYWWVNPSIIIVQMCTKQATSGARVCAIVYAYTRTFCVCVKTPTAYVQISARHYFACFFYFSTCAFLHLARMMEPYTKC